MLTLGLPRVIICNGNNTICSKEAPGFLQQCPDGWHWTFMENEAKVDQVKGTRWQAACLC